MQATTTALEAFAVLIDCSVVACREMGYPRWAKRVLETRATILCMVAFRKVTELGLREAKMFCARVDDNPGPFLEDVGPALAARDVDAIAKIFREHYTFDEPEPAARFAEALMSAFETQ